MHGYARLAGAVQETGLAGVVAEVEEYRLRCARPEPQDLVVHRDEGLRSLAWSDAVPWTSGSSRTSAERSCV